jgi:hypothetical protein
MLAKAFAAMLLVASPCVAGNAWAVNGNGSVTVSGTVQGKGATCMRFRLASGETISLQGASPSEYKKGESLKLTGVWLRVSNCIQGRAFRVLRRVKT